MAVAWPMRHEPVSQEDIEAIERTAERLYSLPFSPMQSVSVSAGTWSGTTTVTGASPSAEYMDVDYGIVENENKESKSFFDID